MTNADLVAAINETQICRDLIKSKYEYKIYSEDDFTILKSGWSLFYIVILCYSYIGSVGRGH